ncbi:MAG TPA: hypothetical protein VJ840_15090 [Gemmatimonadaceae bacterium]|nr:hypothetical protein [Gemmatimonadaceae bacterium]
MKRKYCNFCGEPMVPEAKECKQCGWDISHDGAPTSDPADNKARVGVAAGLVIAYAVMSFLIQGTPFPARADAAPEPRAVPNVEETREPVVEAPTMRLAPTFAGKPATTALTKLISIKVADTKATTVAAHDALEYAFAIPETDQKCRLVGSTHAVSGFGRNIEVFLLTDNDYVFWHANPAAIAQSSWETFRGSENLLDYDLPVAGNYHFVVSNEMGLESQTMSVKAQVKCAW